MPKQINRFNKGIDKDTQLNDLGGQFLRSSNNVELMRTGNYGAATSIRGTLDLNILEGAPFSDFNILWSGPARANVLGTQLPVIVYLYYNNGNSYIKIFVQDTSQVYQLFPNPNIFPAEDLAFPVTGTIEAAVYEDGGLSQVFFVDGSNEMRVVDLEYDGLTWPSLKSLSLLPRDPKDCLRGLGNATADGGAVLTGSYQFRWRYFSTKTCRYSALGNITNAIPVFVDGYGGAIGQPSGKKILLEIVGSDGADDFDSIQLLVIRNVEGQEGNPTSGKLLMPNKGWYDNPSSIEFSGLENGIDVALDEYLIDTISVTSAAAIGVKDDKMFVGNIGLQKYEAPDLAIDNAYSLTRPVDYSIPGDCEKYKSVFRGECYGYGFYLKDIYGVGIVKPVDLSEYIPTAVRLDQDTLGQGTVTSDLGSLRFEITVADTTPYEAGDSIQLGTLDFQVESVTSATVLTVISTIAVAVGTIGDMKILYGQRGNQGDSWAWCFGGRENNQLSIFNDAGQIEALGLRIEGLTGFPDWCSSFEVVRLERKKDILIQTPHVPSVAIQGISTYRISSNNDPADPGSPDIDYKGELDFYSPKIHNLGAAKNLVRIDDFFEIGTFGGDSVFTANGWVRWLPQEDVDGDGEVPSLIYALPPSYLYNIDGLPYELPNTIGASVKFVDAVLLRLDTRFTELDPQAQLTNKRAQLFIAPGREYYFYNREGRHSEAGVDVFFKELTAASFFGSGIFNIDSKVKGQIDLVLGHPEVTLPFRVSSRFDITLWGNAGNLAAQQRESLTVPANRDALFHPDIKNTRGLLLSLSAPISDLSRPAVEARIIDNNNYWPFLTWVPFQSVYDNSNTVDTDFATDDTVGNDNAVGDNEIIGACFVLNVTAGLGPNRYGDINDIQGKWVRTGICEGLTDMDKTLGTKFDFNIFGGDCFITKHSLKVSDSTAKSVAFDPVDDEMLGGENAVSKTGAYEKNVEIIDIYMESTVNSYGLRINDRYPVNAGENLVDYADDFDYYYHRGYSAENDNHPLAISFDICDRPYDPTAMGVYSDNRVRGSRRNPFVDFFGFDTFKANNVFILDGKYGPLSKLIVLGDKALYAFQRDKIAYLPVGVDELKTQDGALIAAGSSDVLGSGDFYMQRDVGSQDPRSIQVRDGRIYAADSLRKVVYAFGARGSNFEMISYKGMDSYFKSYFSNFSPFRIAAHIDAANERYFMTINTFRFGVTYPVYNLKGQYWEMEFTPPLINGIPVPIVNGVSLDGRVYWVASDGHVYEAFSTQFPAKYNTIFGEIVNSSFSVVCNDANTITKVMQVIKIIANSSPVSVRMVVYNETTEPAYDTGELSVHDFQRNHEYHVNNLRHYVSGGRKLKLRGQSAEIFVTFSGAKANNEVIVSALETHYRVNPSAV